ncbi:MAG: gamma-glutamyltransferase family protein [Ignavibacteriaceae bacterium]
MLNKLMKTRYIILTILCVVLSFQFTTWQPGDDPKRGNYAVGNEWMISTAHPLASEAADEMLKLGGNAIDAAVAAAFAIGVVEPDGSGIGGGGAMVVYLKKQDKYIFINYYMKASEDVNKLDYNFGSDARIVKSVLVPGTVAGLTEALEKYGTLPLSTVLKPAIRYAEEGFPIDKTLASLILDNVSRIQQYDATANIFLSDGFPLMEGEILVQTELANTLKKISAEGRDGFYKGAIAEQLVKDINEAGGTITINDFHNYKPQISNPLMGTYRGFQVIAAGLPQSGLSVIEALNILENQDMKKFGHYSTNEDALHLLAETLRRVYADRAAYLGDPKFSYVPVNGLLSKRFARVRFDDIDMNYANPKEYRKTKEGNPNPYDKEGEEVEVKRTTDEEEYFNDDPDDEENAGKRENQLFDSWGRMKKEKKETNKDKQEKKETQKNIDDLDEDFDGGHTTHLCVVDKEGNMVSLTQTLGVFFGSSFSSCGVLLNSSMSNFGQLSEINIPKPNKQPRSSIAPTIITKDGKPFLIIGSPGAARIIATVVQLIVSIIDFNMGVQEANDAPRMFCQKLDDYLYLEGRIPEAVRNGVESKGHNLRVLGDYDLFFGGAQMIMIDWDNHKFFGSADVRRGGMALGF